MRIGEYLAGGCFVGKLIVIKFIDCLWNFTSFIEILIFLGKVGKIFIFLVEKCVKLLV